MKTLNFNQIESGMELPSLIIGKLTHAAIIRYAGASGDFNPIHNDPEAAKAYGLGGTVAHGMFVMAYLGRYCTSLTDKRRVKTFHAKFKGMARPGQTLTCTGKIKRKKEENGEKLAVISMEVADENGEVKVSGEMSVICDH